MSSSRMRSSYLKPPLPKSPIRNRSRHVLLSNSSSTLQTPPGLTKPGRRLSGANKLPIGYSSSISSEKIHALAKMVETEFVQDEEEEEDVRKRAAAASSLEHIAAANSAPVFERGRFYDEYSAKRNEHLKRKSIGGNDYVVKGTPFNLGVEHITTKKKTVETTATEQRRYSLRSMTKENKKPPLPVNVALTSAKKKSVTTTVRARRI